MKNLIESAVIPALTLKVEGREYTVEFPLSAVIKAEEKLGRSLKSPKEWFEVPSRDIPALLEAGLSKHHKDVTPEELQSICDRLNPEALDEVLYALCRLAFPKYVAVLEENLAKARAGTSPNV
jgi:hypothetical protein